MEPQRLFWLKRNCPSRGAVALSNASLRRTHIAVLLSGRDSRKPCARSHQIKQRPGRDDVDSNLYANVLQSGKCSARGVDRLNHDPFGDLKTHLARVDRELVEGGRDQPKWLMPPDRHRDVAGGHPRHPQQ
jgi:hypothetical protein